MLNFKKERNFELVLKEQDRYFLIFDRLIHYLRNSEYYAQANAIDKLVESLRKQDWVSFDKLINGVDMWGGPGAVWEVYIENQNESNGFQNAIVNLIDLMEATKILGSGIKPIRKIFNKSI